MKGRSSYLAKLRNECLIQNAGIVSLHYINTNVKSASGNSDNSEESSPKAESEAEGEGESKTEGARRRLSSKRIRMFRVGPDEKEASPSIVTPLGPQPENQVAFFNKTLDDAVIPSYCQRNLRDIEFYGFASKGQKLISNWRSAAGAPAAKGGKPGPLPLLTPEQFATFYKVDLYVLKGFRVFSLKD